MAQKGIPKRDGSGKGVRANKGRGGCKNPHGAGKGCNRKRAWHTLIVRNIQNNGMEQIGR